MSRRPEQFSTIRTEGALLPADLLARVAAGDRNLDGLGPDAYHLAPGERLNEAINRSWNRLVGAWAAFAEALERMPADERTATNISRSKWSLILFQELGYGQLQTARGGFEVDGKPYPISHAWGTVPIHLPGARVDIDRRTPGVAGASSMSPHGLIQEFLNRSDDHLWGFVTNGLRLRLLRDNVSLTRPAYVEFDLQKMFIGQVYADFVVLWLVCHQSRVEADVPEKCLLEQWMAEAAELGTRALDHLRVGVETAITELGTGFLRHRDNRELREKLRSGELDKRDYQRQLLRLVYRLIFLFVAESRELLLPPDADATTAERYRRFYGLSRLRALAETRRGTAHADLWQALQVVFRGLGAEAGEPALGLPALGSFLWSDRALPGLDAASIDNRHLLAAVRALSVVRDGAVTRSVDYRNLGAEELGSIYESLLELHPDLDTDTGAFGLTTAAGNERKTTGSYYTPTSLINELLDSALEPVLADAAAAADPEAAILALTVLDPACGSGHFLIAAAHRIARRLAAIRTGGDEPSPEATRTALREVVGRCLHGIDANEMAVELCKVSLWMEAVEPGKPLSFLEHRIVHGNSLLGTTPRLLQAGVPDEAFKALSGDDKATVAALKKRNKQERRRRHQLTFEFGSVTDLARPLSAAISAIDALPDDDVASKERQWARFVVSDEREHARLVADAWCAAFVAPKRPGAAVVTDEPVRAVARDPHNVSLEFLTTVRKLSDEYGFLHLHLAFPEVFSLPEVGEEPQNAEMGWSGGFSVILGNPPWERVKLQEKEFFAERVPEIATAPNAAARKRMIAQLINDDPSLHAAYLAAVRHAEGESRLLRASGRYPLCGLGRDINTYTVFAENMRNLVEGSGRVGVIVPSGIATDDTTKLFFGDLVDKQSLVSLFDFENRKHIFPAVDSRTKFCLLTLVGRRSMIGQADFVFFAYRAGDLADPDRRFSLSRADLLVLNPKTRNCSIFSSARQADLILATYLRVGTYLASPGSWSLATRPGLFHMGNDSGLFEEWKESDGRMVPLYEGKMIHNFDHRWAEFVDGSFVDISDVSKEDPSRRAAPRYGIPASIARQKLGPECWLLGFRDITNATNERTVIASAIPGVGCGHTLPLIFSKAKRHILLGILSSFVLDYIARSKVGGTHLNISALEQLPVPAPDAFLAVPGWCDRPLSAWLEIRILEVAFTAWDLSGLAEELDWHGPPFRWDEDRRALLRAEVDASLFHLYGVAAEDVIYIMDSFPIVQRKDEAKFGEYRTKRLILECYEAMARSEATGKPYETVLDPPPADPRCAHPEATRPDWAGAYAGR